MKKWQQSLIFATIFSTYAFLLNFYQLAVVGIGTTIIVGVVEFETLKKRLSSK